jgi:methionyl-tRNA formyltransferase
MKIEFLTQDDPLYVLPFFEEFFRNYASEFEILQASSSRAMGKRPRGQLFRELTSLYGPVGMVRIGAEVVASRLLGALPRGRDAGGFHTLAQLCRAYNLPYKAIASPNAKEFLAEVRERKADVIVSVACPYILKEQLLSLPPLGCVNIHHAPLPRYKGMMPTFWQMYHGEKKVGVTVHYMAAKVDEGAALLQEQLEIEPGESLDHLIRRSKRHGAHSMARVLRQIQNGTQQTIPLNHGEGSYFTFPTQEEIRQFHQRGLRAI